jgi:tetratricopeptide (TPR) repeat protein
LRARLRAKAGQAKKPDQQWPGFFAWPVLISSWQNPAPEPAGAWAWLTPQSAGDPYNSKGKPAIAATLLLPWGDNPLRIMAMVQIETAVAIGALAALLAIVPAQGETLGAAACGPMPLPGQTAIYDYADQTVDWNRNNIQLIWEQHLSKVDPDLAINDFQDALYQLDFALRYTPNHYWALRKLVQIQKEKPGIVYDPGGGTLDHPFNPTTECYFDRALRFRPKDSNLRLLFGVYYHQIRRLDQAMEQYKIAETMRPKSSEIQYNIGLIHYDRKEYQLAAERARRAYDLGYPLPGLRNKLKAAGHWNNTAPASPPK